MKTFNLFVYGTLRHGGHASAMLEGCEPTGRATVKGMLYDIDGRFPAVMLYGDADVHGEIWRCPVELLLRLDEYEGVAESLFRRVGIEATREDGETIPAWVYVAGPALSLRLTPENRVHDGEWFVTPS